MFKFAWLPASQKLFLSYTALRSAPAFLIRLQVPLSRTTDKALSWNPFDYDSGPAVFLMSRGGGTNDVRVQTD